MKKYVLIGTGGALGAILRYLFKGLHIYHYHENVPINTLIINVTGSFLLALILTIAYEVWEFDAGLRLGIATGFIGAYTTFSTLCKETVGLMKEGFYFSAVSYVTVSTMLGLAAVYLGTVLARETLRKLIGKYKDGNIDEETESGVN